MEKKSHSPGEIVIFRTQGQIAIITINNSKKLGALRPQDSYRISCLLQDIAAMPQITVTVLTGTGRFYSAGGDTSTHRPGGSPSHEVRKQILQGFFANELEVTRAFYMHPKILVAALNGPAVGLHAGLLGFADFIYATPHTFLLAPFSSLGLVAEGGSSISFVQRLGLPLATEVLLTSRKIPSERLLKSGFITKIFSGKDEHDSDGFLQQVLGEVEDKLIGDHLNQESLLKIKQLIQRPFIDAWEAQGLREAVEGMQRLIDGAPQIEFKRIASGAKRHKL
ncbi:enoyl-CoA hydratase [Exophiala aquamarina CBS 119918]|uniref:Enoyl-CoA hydratase n=1 Tax=Exophiala aquamarina CBS 119918 TaxID=1182545 RepID=A0A072PJU6_9EURO|nr:enoyl-CoA hydratase [Exophiala aquamarina CBS 119918]KEF59598.1 enoyl-CoA hydratase [Exophiala aquamarina CBS 119918]